MAGLSVFSLASLLPLLHGNDDRLPVAPTLDVGARPLDCVCEVALADDATAEPIAFPIPHRCRIDAAGSQLHFNATGTNSLTSTDNAFGAIPISDAGGEITITTPTTITRREFLAFFATEGAGTWSFTDMAITDQVGRNGGIDVFGNMGTVNFTKDSAGTGHAVTGFLAGGNSVGAILFNGGADS